MTASRVLRALAITSLIGLAVCVVPFSSVVSQEPATTQLSADSKIKSLLNQIEIALDNENLQMNHLIELFVTARDLLRDASPDGRALMVQFPDRLNVQADKARVDGKLMKAINFEVFAKVVKDSNDATVAKAATPQPSVALAEPPRPVIEPPKPEPIIAKIEPAAPKPSPQRALVDRGDAMLKLGNVSAARMLYARAAESGLGIAALKLADTYDQTFLADHNLRGIKPDQTEAETWYRKAVSLGEVQAEQRLKALESRRLANLLVKQ